MNLSPMEHIERMERKLLEKRDRIVGSGYTEHVGRKFNADGSPMRFPGGTVISFVDAARCLHRLVLRIRDAYRKSSFAGKLIFLPPASYHITIFIVFNDCDRDTNHWSANLATDTPAERVHAYMLPRLQRPAPPSGLLFSPTYVDGDTIRLVPANTGTAEALGTYRNRLSRAVGVRFPDHENYRYHITFAYRIEKLTPAEYDELIETNRRCTRIVQGCNEAFPVPPPVYTEVMDMTRFRVRTSNQT